MNSITHILNGTPAIIDGPFWFTALLKITLLLSIAWLIHFAIAAMNPRWRVVLWRSVTVGVAAVLLLDGSRLISLPMPISSPTVKAISSQPEFVSSEIPFATQADTTTPIENQNANLNPHLTMQPENFEAAAEQRIATSESLTWWSLAKSHWRMMLGFVWLLGILFLIAKEVIGSRRLLQVS